MEQSISAFGGDRGQPLRGSRYCLTQGDFAVHHIAFWPVGLRVRFDRETFENVSCQHSKRVLFGWVLDCQPKSIFLVVVAFEPRKNWLVFLGGKEYCANVAFGKQYTALLQHILWYLFEMRRTLGGERRVKGKLPSVVIGFLRLSCSPILTSV